MASCLRVRALSTASSALLKLKHHHRCYTTVQRHNKLASRISRSPQFVFSPSFSRLFGTTDRSASATHPTTDDDDTYGSESDSDSDSDSEFNSHSDSDEPSQAHAESNIDSTHGRFVPESGYSNVVKVDWHINSKCSRIPYTDNPFIQEGSKNVYELKMEKEWVKLRMDMPGIDKKGVKATFTEGLLVLRGVEPDAGASDGEVKRDYIAEIQFATEESKLMKVKDANAEMKDGVLRVAIPRITLEERKKTTHIPIK